MSISHVLLGVLLVFLEVPHEKLEQSILQTPPLTNIRSHRQRSYREGFRNNKRPYNNLIQGLFQTNKPYRQDYLALLKNNASYGPPERRWRPDFTYEHQDHPELIRLRQTYKLEDVAGSGSELSQIIRLLNWAHKSIPYDGTRGVPAERNAMSIIRTAEKNKCGFDCRGMATILNEAYLSMGFESRILSCFPKDTNDREHHVLTLVYSHTLNKWLWMDPANNAYVMDENGNMLSIDEVRERLISDQKVTINKDANLNNKPVTTKQYIYDYMTKNLFWFQSPLHSGFDTETPQRNKLVSYVALFPSGFSPYGKADIRTPGGIAYMTSNQDYFWQKPKEIKKTMPKKSRRKG